MPNKLTLKLLPALLALSAVPLSTGCGQVEPPLSTPPADRFAPEAYPAVPAGEADCEGEPCLSDRQTGEVINSLVDALDRANSRLLWLRDYFRPK